MRSSPAAPHEHAAPAAPRRGGAVCGAGADVAAGVPAQAAHASAITAKPHTRSMCESYSRERWQRLSGYADCMVRVALWLLLAGATGCGSATLGSGTERSNVVLVPMPDVGGATHSF